MSLLLALAALAPAAAGEAPTWAVSQRWQYTHLYDVGDETVGRDTVGYVGGAAYQHAFSPALFQTTTFAAHLSNDRVVGFLLGTDGDFRVLRSLAASYMDPRWRLSYQRGNFPISFGVLNPLQTSRPRSQNSLLLPDGGDLVRSWSLLTAAHTLGSNEAFRLGLSWARYRQPMRIGIAEEYDDGTLDTVGRTTDDSRVVLDGQTTVDALSLMLQVSFTELSLLKPCPRAVCVRGAYVSENALGFGRTMASPEARERFIVAQGVDFEGARPVESVTPVWGFSGYVAHRGGLMAVVPVGSGVLALEGGYGIRQIFVTGFQQEGRTYYAGMSGGGAVGLGTMMVYHGPGVELHARF